MALILSRVPSAMPASSLPAYRSNGAVPCMGRLERLGWTAGISFVVHGARIGIRANDTAALERLPERLPPGWKPARLPVVDDLYSVVVGSKVRKPRIRPYNLLYLQSVRLARTMDLDELLESLAHRLHFNVAVKARHRLFVHAGVVGWRGRAIVVPGRSMTGKTSLVEALVRAGATYYSDDYAVFDRRGRIYPYAKPLSVRGEGSGAPRHLSVESLGGRLGITPLPVGLAVVTRYEAGARWRPRGLSPGQALLALLSHTLLARSRSELALETLQQALKNGAVVLKSKRGEAGETACLLLDYLEEIENIRDRRESSPSE